jgi:hypothetical protein
VFENRVLRRMFIHKGDEEVTGEWRDRHNYELRDLYSSPSIIRMIEEDVMDGACSMNGVKRNAYTLLMGNPEDKIPLGRPRRRWVDDVKINLVAI